MTRNNSNVADAWNALLTDEARTIGNRTEANPEKYNPTGNRDYGLKDGETELRVVENSRTPRVREYQTHKSAGLTLNQAMNVEGWLGPGSSYGLLKTLVPVGPERPPQHVYRVMSTNEFNSARERGYIQSDERMNLASGEGTVASLSSTSGFYAPTDGSDYHIVRIRYHDADGWQRDPADGYVKTNKRIPFHRVDAFSPPIAGNAKTVNAPKDRGGDPSRRLGV